MGAHNMVGPLREGPSPVGMKGDFGGKGYFCDKGFGKGLFEGQRGDGPEGPWRLWTGTWSRKVSRVTAAVLWGGLQSKGAPGRS